MIAQASILLDMASAEMQSYHDDRSEAWQESSQAEELLEKLELLQETVSQLQALE